MKKTIQNIAGYVLGGVMFVVLLPTIMWLASGMPALEHIGALRASLTGLLMLGGLTLSVWTIVYMKRRGKGNPMDAFGHEVGSAHTTSDDRWTLSYQPQSDVDRDTCLSRVIYRLAMDVAGSIGVGYFSCDHVRASTD